MRVDGKKLLGPVWFPPELAEKNHPDSEYPLPLPDDRDLTLPEKYAALVAIHVLHAKGAKIKPWPTRPSPLLDEHYWESRLCSVDCRDSTVGWILFQMLLNYARRTPETDVKWLRGILLDVAADLRRRAKPSTSAPAADRGVKRKRSSVKGEAREKLIAALTKHHQYAEGGCLNLEPIGNNELARLAEVAGSTVSEFFNREFNEGQKRGFAKYRVICREPRRLADSLKALRGEFSPHELYGRRPPAEDERDDEE